jgi:hypothetical protein
MASRFHGVRRRSTVFQRALARAVMLAGLVAAASPLHAETAAPPAEPALTVPGGIARLAELVGVDPDTPRALFLMQVIRRIHDAPWGASENTGRLLPPVLAHLDRMPRLGEGAADYVPLPLGPQLWSAVVFRTSVDPGRLLRALLADRKASLLYHGLLALDGPTLRFLASNPGLLREIHAHAAHTFATTARSLSVENGVVRVPGGDALRASWESLVGRPSTSADRFLGELLGRDDGRLAFFFDTLLQLDEPRLLFATRGSTGGATSLDGLYETFRKADPGWQIRHRPFARMAFDSATLLMAVRVTADGQFAGPGGRKLWDGVLSGDADRPSVPGRLDEPGPGGGAVDAVWLASRVARATPEIRQQLVETLSFGQRVFADATDRDSPDVLAALQGVRRYPMLGLTLERMGIRTPSLHARMVRVASRLADLDQADGAPPPVLDLQAALALVERLVFRRVVDSVVAASLVERLAARVEPWSPAEHGVVADWLTDDFLPTLERIAGPGESREAVLVRALAGLSGGPREPVPVVRWEGAAYRVAPNETLLERLAQIRRRQGRSLDHALAVVREARLAAVENVVEGVKASVGRSQAAVGEAHGSQELGELSIRVLSLRERDDARARSIVERLASLGDRMLSEALSGLVYAAALAEATEWLPDARDLNLRHRPDAGATRAERARAAWQLPVEISGPDVRWHFAGSLLGLDMGLAALRLRRISSEPPLQAPRLNENDRRTFVQSVALLNPARLTDVDRDAIATALKLGRARVRALAGGGGDLKAAAARAGLGAWRTRAAEWTIAHEPDRLGEIWSTRELLALGADGDRRYDEWGLSAVPIDGSLRTRLSDAAPWESIAGRPMTGQLAAFVPDLHLRTAEALADRGLPAELAPSVLASAVQCLVDEVQPAYMDDWQALVAYVRNLPAARFDDYISLLTADGPLVPASEPAHSESR